MTALATGAAFAFLLGLLLAVVGVYLLAGAGVARLVGWGARRRLDRRTAFVVVAFWPLVVAGFVATTWVWVGVGALLELARGAWRFLRWIGDVATAREPVDLGEFDLTPEQEPPRRPLNRWERAAVYLGLLDPDEPNGLSREELVATIGGVAVLYGLLGLLWLVHYLAGR